MTKETDKLKTTILAQAVALAREHGLHQFSRIDVATAAGVGESTVSYHFGTMRELRIAICKYAVQKEILCILADARSSREPAGVPMSPELKERVAAFITR